MGFQAGLGGTGADAADKVQALLLPEVEVAVAVVVAVIAPGRILSNDFYYLSCNFLTG